LKGLLIVALASAFTTAAPSGQPADPTTYDARFTFVRLRFTVAADPNFGMGGRGMRDPPWHHDYPTADNNLMRIIHEVTKANTAGDAYRIIDIGDPELFKYPVAYMSEPGFWTMTDQEAANLRDYLLKGGFIIFDDFGGNHWANMSTQMARLLPQARWLPLDAAHPIFHAFFEIPSLDNLLPNYRGIPSFFGLFEDNDPTKRMFAIANYNNDIGESWEFSETGLEPVDESNQAYKFGINYMIYALTH